MTGVSGNLPPPPNPGKTADDPAADGALKEARAKQLSDPLAARVLYEEIIRKHRGTRAARLAQEYLDVMDGKDPEKR